MTTTKKIRKIELWPVGKYGDYDSITGEKEEQKATHAVPGPIRDGLMVHCPGCHQRYFTYGERSTKHDIGKINYCWKCGRFLWNPFTRWEKIRFWFSQFGDMGWMARFPMFRITEDDKPEHNS